MKPEGMNVGVVIWVLWMSAFVYLMVKGRNTFPLRGGADPLALLGLAVALLAIGTIYVWWANRRDSK
jgi:membrane protein DedA with SNARE-associated domain